MIHGQRLTRLMLVSLLVLSLPTDSSAEEPSEELETESLFGVRPKHTGQVSFGYGTNGAISALTGTYTLSPKLYARYGIGTHQDLWLSSQSVNRVNGNTGIAATQFFLSLGSPSVFQFGGGVDVGAELFMSNGPLFQYSLLNSDLSRRGFDRFNYGSSHFMSPWHQRAWGRDPLAAGKAWYIEFQVEQTTPSGTRGGRATISK